MPFSVAPVSRPDWSTTATWTGGLPAPTSLVSVTTLAPSGGQGPGVATGSTGRAADLDGVALLGHLVDRIGAVDDDVRDDPVRLEDPNDPDDGPGGQALLAIGE